MTIELKLAETFTSNKYGSLVEVYVLSMSTKVRGEKNCTTVKTYGVTVDYMMDNKPYIFRNGIYNMVTGRTRFVKKISDLVLEMIESGKFTKAPYFKEI